MSRFFSLRNFRTFILPCLSSSEKLYESLGSGIVCFATLNYGLSFLCFSKLMFGKSWFGIKTSSRHSRVYTRWVIDLKCFFSHLIFFFSESSHYVFFYSLLKIFYSSKIIDTFKSPSGTNNYSVYLYQASFLSISRPNPAWPSS